MNQDPERGREFGENDDRGDRDLKTRQSSRLKKDRQADKKANLMLYYPMGLV